MPLASTYLAWVSSVLQLPSPHTKSSGRESARLHCVTRSGVSGSSATPLTVAHQSPLSLGFSRQEYRSGLPSSSVYQIKVLGLRPIGLDEPDVGHGSFPELIRESPTGLSLGHGLHPPRWKVEFAAMKHVGWGTGPSKSQEKRGFCSAQVN